MRTGPRVADLEARLTAASPAAAMIIQHRGDAWMAEMRRWQLESGSSDDDALTVIMYWEGQPRGKPDMNVLWWAQKRQRAFIAEAFPAVTAEGLYSKPQLAIVEDIYAEGRV